MWKIKISAFLPGKGQWIALLQETLGPEFVMISSHSLMGMHLALFVSVRILPLVTRVETTHLATGLMGKIGNKGGISISFKIGETSIIFINNHLASGREDDNDRKRVEDYLRLKSELWNSDDASEDYDVCIWSGDFNFRIKGTF
jgi:phosphatidylinositol-bisphosphatase